MVPSLRAGVAWTLALGAAGDGRPARARGAGHRAAVRARRRRSSGWSFSLAMGLWVTRVLEHSAQRAALIQELESTRAELAELHHQQGMVAERERLAREVHDTLAQGYTSIVVLAQTAAAALPGDPSRRPSGWR